MTRLNQAPSFTNHAGSATRDNDPFRNTSDDPIWNRPAHTLFVAGHGAATQPFMPGRGSVRMTEIFKLAFANGLHRSFQTALSLRRSSCGYY